MKQVKSVAGRVVAVFGLACLLPCRGAALARDQETVAPDVAELTVEKIERALAAGEYTVVSLTQAFLDRIERYEPIYNAFISLNPTRSPPPPSSTPSTLPRARAAPCTACQWL